MITLPSGVTLREFFAPADARGEIFRRVREGFMKRFPMENQKVRLELDTPEYDEKKSKFSLEQYQDAILSGGRLTTPLRGNMRLIDKATGQKLDERETVLANVPYMTDDGTFIYGGSHYTVNNQSRLKSGIYARRKDNGELESHINTKSGTGPSMRVFMEPETGVYRVQVDKSNIKLYPVLRALGVSDEALQASWGDKVLKENQDAFDRKAFDKFYEKLLRNKARPEATPEERTSEIQALLGKTRLDPEVNTRTLGRPHETVSTDALVDASAKLLRINLGQSTEDDRDHPANRTFHSVEDFLGDRVERDSGRLANNLLYRSTYDRTLKALKPGYFSPQLETMIVGNSLASPTPGINIVELYDQNRRVVQTGEGGISSMDAVPMSSRNVHPGQLGLIDPIRSSESRAVGIDQRFSIGAMKGSDNQVYYPLRNKKSGQLEYMHPAQLHGKIIAFPKAPSLEKFKTPSPGANALGAVLGLGGPPIPEPSVPPPQQSQTAADFIGL